MKYIYSKIEPELLLHVIFRFEDFNTIDGFRNNIISPDNFIQCAALKMDSGKTFRPHKHITNEVTENKIAQESWIVLKGKVRCSFFDIDDKILDMVILNEGDCSFTLRGGHNYFIIEDNTKVLEYKTGPYTGQESDKIFI